MRNTTKVEKRTVQLVQSVLYLQEINKIKRLFEQNNIDFVFLKGLPLHLYYENEFPRRIYADCDLLIQEKDYNLVSDLLSQQDYIQCTHELYPLQSYFRRSNPLEVSFSKKIGGVKIEFDIHTSIVFSIPTLGYTDKLYPTKLLKDFTQKCLKTKRAVNINNFLFPIISPSLLIVYLSLHLFNHLFTGPYRFKLLKKIMEYEFHKNHVDWPTIQRIIREYSLENYIYPVFLIAKREYSIAIPDYIITSLEPTSFLAKKRVKTILSRPRGTYSNRKHIGIERFINLFLLSPVSWYRRLTIFTDLSVLITIIVTVWQKGVFIGRK